jgi:hypothetical protein
LICIETLSVDVPISIVSHSEAHLCILILYRFWDKHRDSRLWEYGRIGARRQFARVYLKA